MLIYRYFYLNSKKDIFGNITANPSLNEDGGNNYAENIALNGFYDLEYLQRRIITEKIMYDIFVSKGGKPKCKHPFYMTLGCCDEWFFEKKHCFGSVALDLENISEDCISFTYGDSIPTFKDEHNDGKEYRKNVYTLKEINNLIEKYGYPNKWNTFEKHGLENYIEVQIWDDEVFKDFDLKYNPNAIRKITDAIILANKNIDNIFIEEKGLNYYLSLIKNSSLYIWYKNLIINNQTIFIQGKVHGYEHALKCSLYAFILSYLNSFDCKRTKELIYASYYHDLGRNSSEKYKSHAEISSKLVENYIKEKDVDIDIIKNAIRLHNLNISGNDIIIDLLKDIDSLDYLRLGLGTFDLAYIKDYNVKKMVRVALELNLYMFYDFDSFKRILLED